MRPSSQKGVMSMTYFESVGVERQYNANSLEKADREFARSCKKCATQGKPIRCAQCAIDFAHSVITACFNNRTA